jgi:hypothetical protein
VHRIDLVHVTAASASANEKPAAGHRPWSPSEPHVKEVLRQDIAHVMRSRALDGYGMDVCSCSPHIPMANVAWPKCRTRVQAFRKLVCSTFIPRHSIWKDKVKRLRIFISFAYRRLIPSPASH